MVRALLQYEREGTDDPWRLAAVYQVSDAGLTAIARYLRPREERVGVSL